MTPDKMPLPEKVAAWTKMSGGPTYQVAFLSRRNTAIPVLVFLRSTFYVLQHHFRSNLRRLVS